MNVFLFSVEANAEKLLMTHDMELDIKCNAHENMTTEEWERFQEHLQECCTISRNALIRKVNEGNVAEDDEFVEEE